MEIHAVFGISALLSFVSSGVLAALYVWPWLRKQPTEKALLVLVAPHMFFRFIGLSFLVPGVVSPSIPMSFAIPAAYGDMLAGLLAIVATLALTKRVSWAAWSVWAFNVLGAADLVNAGVQGQLAGMAPGSLGAAFFIPTAIVPPLLTTHALVFLLLVRPRAIA
jgi:hypothetical protein